MQTHGAKTIPKNSLGQEISPFAFSKDHLKAHIEKKPQYISPDKRRQMKEFLSNSSINFNGESSMIDKNFDQFKSSYNVNMAPHQTPGFDKVSEQRTQTLMK